MLLVLNGLFKYFYFASKPQQLSYTQALRSLRLDNGPRKGGPFILTLQYDWLFKHVRQREREKEKNTANPAHFIRVGCSKTK